MSEPSAAPPLEFAKTEVKYLAREGDESAGLDLFRVGAPAPTERTIWFFDTPARDLFAQGIFLRARLSKSGATPSDVTFKLRGARVAEIQAADLLLPGKAKLEGDQPGVQEARPSYSLGVDLSSGAVIEQVAAGTAAVSALFSAAQSDLITRFLAGFTLADVSLRGPVSSQTWTFAKGDFPGFPHELTVELWQIGSRQVLEFSDKMDSSKAAVFATKLAAFLGSKHVGFDPSSKTELALKMKNG
jgi:hypothetical protein